MAMVGAATPADQKKILHRIREPIALDGRLLEPAWQKAPDAGSLLSVPLAEEGSASPPATQVKVLYDDTMLFVGFLNFDPEPDRMEALETKRDGDLRSDESVFILIESPPETRLFLFGVNVLGAMTDGIVLSRGKTVNLDWDGRWQAASLRTAAGWSAEIAIELTSLGTASRGERTLGLRLSRIIPRLCPSFWKGPVDPAFRAADLDRLARFTTASSDGRTPIDVHLMPAWSGKGLGRSGGGVQIRRSFAPDGGLQLALNPDFTTVEPDREIINLTRFEIEFPEKRDFFRSDETAGPLPIRLSYSKRVGEIWGGVAGSGEEGGWSFSGWSVLAKREDASRTATGNVSSFRVGRSLGSSFDLAIAAAGRFERGSAAGGAEVDLRAALSPGLTLAGQAVLSFGPHRSENLAYAVRSSFDTANLHAHLGFARIGARFADNLNTVGFVPDDDRKEIEAALVKTFPFAAGRLRAVRVESRADAYWGTGGGLRGWEAVQGCAADFTSKFSLDLSHTQEYRLFEKPFRNHRTRFGLDYNAQSEWQAVGLHVTFGRNFDVAFDLAEIGKRLRIGPGFQFEYSLGRLRSRGAAPGNPEGHHRWIHSLNLVRFIGKGAAFRLYVQYHYLEARQATENGPLSMTHPTRLHGMAFLDYPLAPPWGTIQAGYRTVRTEFGVREREGGLLFVKWTLGI